MKQWITLLFLFLFLYPSYAKENLNQFRFDGAKDFLGGLNASDSPNILKSQSPDIRNFSTDEKLGLVKREGYTFADRLPVSTSTKILNTYVFVKDDGTSFVMVHVGSTVFSASQLGDVWTVVETDLSSNYPIRFATHYNKVFCSNGINDVFVWNGNARTVYPFIPRGQYPLSANGRLWMGATIDDPSYVYFSEINVDPVTTDDWTDTNALEFGLGDGQIIKGLSFQRGSVWVYKDVSTYGIRDITSKYLALADYGTASQFSINKYDNGKLFLDKTGFYYFAGGNVAYKSGDIRTLLDGVGLISANSVRISASSNVDFATGTYSNCYNNSGTIEISSITKIWTTSAEFQDTGYSQSQVISTDNVIVLDTLTGASEEKISLSFNTKSGGHGNFDGTTTLGSSGGETKWYTDDSDATWSCPVSSVQQYLLWLNVAPSTSATCHPKRIRVRFRQVVWDGPFNQLLPIAWHWTGHWLDALYIDTYNAEFGARVSITKYTTKYEADWQEVIYTVEDGDYNDPSRGHPARIQIGWISPFVATPIAGVAGRGYDGIQIADISAWTISGTSKRFQTGTYISSILDSGQTTSQYQFLSVADYLGTASSSGTITYSARSDDASDMSSPTAWTTLGISSGGTISFPISTVVDEQRYFQWKADIWTSTITNTPSISDVTLSYATTDYATRAGKVHSISKKITTWGSFISNDTGEVTYAIRGATWNFGGGEATLQGSDSTQYTTITNGSDIKLSTTNIFIQVKTHLKSKDAEFYGMSLTYSENPEGIGGTQEISSINIDGVYHFACSTWTTNNDIVLVFNENEAWEMWDEYYVTSFFKFNNTYYFASSTQPIICKMFSGYTATEAKWKSPHTDLDLPNIDKTIRYGYITFEPYDDSFCFLEYSCDFSTFSEKVFMDLSGNSRVKRIPFRDGYWGQNFYFTITSTAQAPVEIQHLDIYWQRTFELRPEKQ